MSDYDYEQEQYNNYLDREYSRQQDEEYRERQNMLFEDEEQQRNQYHSLSSYGSFGRDLLVGSGHYSSLSDAVICAFMPYIAAAVCFALSFCEFWLWPVLGLFFCIGAIFMSNEEASFFLFRWILTLIFYFGKLVCVGSAILSIIAFISMRMS